MNDSTVVNNVVDSWLSSSEVLAAILSLGIAIVVGLLTSALTYRYTRKLRLEAEWRVDKLNQYRQLILSLSEYVNWRTEDDFDKSMIKLAHAINTLSLVAPQSLLETMSSLSLSLTNLNKDKSDEASNKAKALINKLVIEIRDDLNITPKDDLNTFNYTLIAGKSVNSK